MQSWGGRSGDDAVAALVALRLEVRGPGWLFIAGGALFLALFASANPLIESAFAGMILPDATTVIWRGFSRLADLVEGARIVTNPGICG